MGVCSIVLVVNNHFEAFCSESAPKVPLPDRRLPLSRTIAVNLCPGLEDKEVGVRIVLSQGMFPWDAELCAVLVHPMDTRIVATVDLLSQPGDEQCSWARHFWSDSGSPVCCDVFKCCLFSASESR